MKLRFKPKRNLSVDAVKAMLKKRMFFDAYWNKQGRGLRHDYKSVERNGAKLVIDYATGLTWQQGGSDSFMNFAAAQEYIQQLNCEKLAGYSDWRLPTLEEAKSLVEPEKKNGGSYIDPVFDKNQRWIWTADRETSGVSESSVWSVYFVIGDCETYLISNVLYVRAVRSGQ